MVLVLLWVFTSKFLLEMNCLDRSRLPLAFNFPGKYFQVCVKLPSLKKCGFCDQLRVGLSAACRCLFYSEKLHCAIAVIQNTNAIFHCYQTYDISFCLFARLLFKVLYLIWGKRKVRSSGLLKFTTGKQITTM